MKRILIVYATAGIGHKKAALAVKEALDELVPKDIEATIIDALDYAPPLFKWSYLQLYLLAVNKLSFLWGFMYYLTDNFYVNLIVSRLRRLNNWLNSKRFVKYLVASKPDVIVTTHFFPSEVIADLKRRGALGSHVITVVTDYRLHSWWVSDFVDTYIVSNEDAQGDLERAGIPLSRVEVLGIPVEPIFSKTQDKEAIRKTLGLERGVFTILVIGGGFGVGPMQDIVKIIAATSTAVQVIVICGHNEELMKKMEALKSGLNINLKILGFVNNVYDFMEASNLLISKSGGITVTESLAKELPMIVFSPIPGQETRNSDYLLKNGAALKAENLSELKEILKDLMVHPERLEEMKTAIRRIRKPLASHEIAEMAVRMSARPMAGIKNG